MIVEFWKFSKRHNSMKRPSTNAQEVSFAYKDINDIHNPVIEVTTDVKNYNYARIGNIYFFVESLKTVAKNLWNVSLKIDLLATYKDEILANKTKVLFSSSMYDLSIIDNRIISTGKYERQSNTAQFIGTLSNHNITPNGTFALTALSNTSIWATGATTTYFMTYQQMQRFARELVDANAWESFKQFFNNPMDGIIECYYLPLDISQYIDLSVDGEVQIGDYAFPETTAKKALATNLTPKSFKAQIEIPWVYDDFRRLQPYTEISLYVPFCGSKSISPEMVYNIDAIFIDYSIDVVTGNIQAIAYNKEEVLAEFSGNCKVVLPVGQTQSRADSILGGIGGAAIAIAGFAVGSPVVGVGGIASAVTSVVTPATNNTMGSMSGSVLGATIGNETKRWQQFRLSITSRKTADNPAGIRSTIGNALNKIVTLSELSGYVQTISASVSVSAYESETISINNLLDGGVYIE